MEYIYNLIQYGDIVIRALNQTAYEYGWQSEQIAQIMESAHRTTYNNKLYNRTKR